MPQGVEKNPYAKFRQNSLAGYREDAITGKIQGGQRWPYLSTDPGVPVYLAPPPPPPPPPLYLVPGDKIPHGILSPPWVILSLGTRYSSRGILSPPRSCFGFFCLSMPICLFCYKCFPNRLENLYFVIVL